MAVTNPPEDLAGSTQIVVGSNGAIGHAVAQALSAAGARVIGLDMGPTPREPGADHRQVDVEDPTAICEVLAEVLGECADAGTNTSGALGMVVATGLYPARYTSDETAETLSQVLRANTVLPALLTSTFAQVADQSRTRAVVLTSSLAARRSRIGSGAYSASKVALERLVETIALEHLGTGLRINCVQPGYVSAGSTINPIPDDYEAAMSERIGGLVVPADLVDSYLWLLSERSAMVNGESLAVDRGLHIGRTDDQAWVSEPRGPMG
ncbi:SDR family oxidoreductase [Brevibacterium litoralis]|uniref:SDR family oxidoreductase n=1 Tax=Brevibacterium litoralis TaxID=3138935 RepID=UPI0032EFDEDD